MADDRPCQSFVITRGLCCVVDPVAPEAEGSIGAFQLLPKSGVVVVAAKSMGSIKTNELRVVGRETYCGVRMIVGWVSWLE